MDLNPAEKLTNEELASAHTRFLDAVRLQEIEGNPLDAEQIAMFEMFERERWPHARCTEYLLDRARRAAGGSPSGE